MKRFRIDQDAQRDLIEIHAYIAKGSLAAADRLIDTIRDKFRLLSTQPLIGQARPELAVNLRSFSVGNYVVYYRPTKFGIEVARVLHGARDVDAQFAEPD